MSSSSGVIQVIYSQNGEQKSIPEDQAIHMLDAIAEQDMQRALVHSLTLTQANPDARRLLWSFYEKLLAMYMFEDLLSLSNERLAQHPDCAVSLSWKLDALRHMFRHQEAIETLQAAYLKDPGDYNALTMLGTFYKDEGDFDQALVCFDHAIKVNPHYAPPYWYRADLSTDASLDYDAVKAQISAAKVHESRAHFLQFAAHRHAEKLGDYQAAFEHLSFGNGLKRHTLRFDLNDELAVDQKAREIFTASKLATLESAQESDLRPIFIMGMPRSGTTLVEQIIASHSDVAGGDEYTALANAIMRVQRLSQQRGSVDDWLNSRTANDWQKVGRAYEDNMRFIRGDKKVFTDKNQFNHRSIGVIKAALPNAKIIFVDRQPMDVLFGCYRQLFGTDGAPFSYQYDELVQMYASYTQLLNYWCEHTQDMIMRIQYEDLVIKPKDTTNAVLAFCGLAQEQACYDFHQSKRSVKTLSGTQVRQPIFTRGIERWKTYESQLGGLLNKAKKSDLL